MKKFLLVILAFTFAHHLSAQLKVGINAGVPIGDYSDFYTVSFGADVYYLFGEPDALLQLGLGTGYLNYIGDEVEILGTTLEIDNASFIPVAAAARFTLLKILTFGPDVGYGIGISEGNDGGFYWRGVVGLDIGNRIELNAYYHSIIFESATTNESSALSTIGIGLLFEFYD